MYHDILWQIERVYIHLLFIIFRKQLTVRVIVYVLLTARHTHVETEFIKGLAEEHV